MGKVIRVIERCLGCGTEREVDMGSPRWPTVWCPGLGLDYPERRNRMGVCPDCSEKITEPVHTVGDFDRQLGRESYLTLTSKVRLGPSEPFLGALRRSAKARRLKVSQT
jgi:hypothetical protein